MPTASKLPHKSNTDFEDLGVLEKMEKAGPSAAWLKYANEFMLVRPIEKKSAHVSLEELKPNTTRLIYIISLAEKAFGDRTMARDFMFRKHPKLKTAPINKLKTEWGGRQVERILQSMMFGLPS